VRKKSLLTIVIFFFVSAGTIFAQTIGTIGQTKITNWQYGKKTAISLTYDDNTINQFRVALPLMKKYGFPATFFVITGIVPGSEYQPKFIGPPVDKIIAETAKKPTNKDNFFLRASALRFTGYKGTYSYFMKIGGQFGQGHLQKAYNLTDEIYKKIRNRKLKPSNDSLEVQRGILKYGQSTYGQSRNVPEVTWKQLKKYQSEGYEFGSHTISHPYVSILDSVNIMYELKKSKLELQNHLGKQAVFSAEIPFGISNHRAIKYGLRIYEALRNLMPEPYLTEINRGDSHNPTHSDKDYVQWQRGPLTNTPMKEMKSWVNTALSKDNIWLVLVIHGVEGIGWEPLSKKELQEYFSYIKSKEKNIWIATFKDVTKYMRERESAAVRAKKKDSSIIVNLSDSLNDPRYNLPLTLKTYVSPRWNIAKVRQGKNEYTIQSRTDKHGRYVLYQAKPNGKPISIEEQKQR
jgi:peptidoglycan/xylan/chitin deacetylase (PgdA/CDA1 family)